MSSQQPRIVLIGGTYRAFCVLERLVERGERVVAFIGQEGSRERDFCPEVLELCDRQSIPARSVRKLGEEIVRWLEDRIRPDLAIAIGVNSEIPLAIGGNCRLGMIELADYLHDEGCDGIAIRSRGRDVASRPIACDDEDNEAGDAYLRMVDAMLSMLDDYLSAIGRKSPTPAVSVSFAPADASGSEALANAASIEPGPATDKLEASVACYLGAEHVVAVDSSRAAFQLLLEPLELVEGDQVILPALASGAAIEAVQKSRAVPVYADVQVGCLTLDPDHLRAAITEHTRALILSHPFGQPAELDAIYGIAADAGIEVIEDACSGLGAAFEESRIGRSPCTAVFQLPITSFASSSVPSLISLAPALAERIGSAAQSLRLGDGAAALALERLASWEGELAKRRAIASHYSSELVPYDAFRVPVTPQDRIPAYANYLLRITRFSRTTATDLNKLMNENGIETRLVCLPLTQRELADLPVAEQARAQAILLPIGSHLSERELDLVLDGLFGFAIG